jgi:hypothetical protein
MMMRALREVRVCTVSVCVPEEPCFSIDHDFAENVVTWNTELAGDLPQTSPGNQSFSLSSSILPKDSPKG